MNYKSYLQIEKLLSSQAPLSAKGERSIHDEYFFIISHQICELWFKQILLELDSAIQFFYTKSVKKKDMVMLLIRFERIIRIQKLLIGVLEGLETIDTMGFLDFRHLLGSASGLQSFQFRLMEIQFGLQEKSRLHFNQKILDAFFSEEEKQQFKMFKKMNLFYGFQKWLESMPFLKVKEFDFKKEYMKNLEILHKKEKKTIQESVHLNHLEKQKNINSLNEIERNFQKIMEEGAYHELQKKGLWQFSYLALKAALIIQVYGKSHFFLPSRIIESLIEMDSQFTIWRFRHAMMVKKVLGVRPGTGGSTGVKYLFQTVDQHRVYRDLVQLKAFFLPRSYLPILPQSFKSL